VDPARVVTQLIQHARQAGRHAAQFGVKIAQAGRHCRLRHAQAERERHEALLRAVVEIALDTAPGLVGGSNDARARGHQCGMRFGIRDRGGREEFGELGEPMLGACGEGLGARRRDQHHAPQPARHPDRRASRRTHPSLNHALTGQAGVFTGVVDACGLIALEHHSAHSPPAKTFTAAG
jgi:hypothetical protein